MDTVYLFSKTFIIQNSKISRTERFRCATVQSCELTRHFYNGCISIRQKTLPPKHPHLANSYNNIALVYEKMGEYSKALSYHGKALEIEQKALPENHPSLATSYNNIGFVYKNIGEYSKALSYYEHALNIRQRTLPPDHPDIKEVRENIEIVKKKL